MNLTEHENGRIYNSFFSTQVGLGISLEIMRSVTLFLVLRESSKNKVLNKKTPDTGLDENEGS